jgi:hypothetical protein
MKIIKNFCKPRHPDYYRKKYWDGTHTKDTAKKLGFNNEVFTTEHYLDCHTTLVITNSDITQHTDYAGMSYLIVLHNYVYQFNYQRNLFQIPTGSLLIFDLDELHGIDKVQTGSNLFIALALDICPDRHKPSGNYRDYLKSVLPLL